MGLLWGGYTLGLWGYLVITSHIVTLGDLVIPGRGTWPFPTYTGSPSGPYGGQLGGGPGNPTRGGNGVAPGDHPGDMPWTYPSDPNSASA